MNKRKEPATDSRKPGMLKPTDHAVLSFLEELIQASGSDTCTASIPSIAAACNISPRQVQISTGRLIEAGFISRIGYDFGNAVRSKRGTKYKLLKPHSGLNNGGEFEKVENCIQSLIERQSRIELSLKEFRLKQGQSHYLCSIKIVFIVNERDYKVRLI